MSKVGLVVTLSQMRERQRAHCGLRIYMRLEFKKRGEGELGEIYPTDPFPFQARKAKKTPMAF